MTGRELLAVVVLAGALAAAAETFLAIGRRRVRRTAASEIRRRGVRVSRARFVSRAEIRRQILGDPAFQSRLRDIARRRKIPDRTVRRRAKRDLDEIVPAFSILTYFRVGAWLARKILGMFYRVAVDRAELARIQDSLEPGGAAIYVMNHRSNVDYVLVAHTLMKTIAISYAVGEWARVWPLEMLFKAFGSYFVRRKSRSETYHATLEHYVGWITREGVPQGIFLEGGLSRDGRLHAPRYGLLAYILRALPSAGPPVVFIPCGINYDRVIEDRVLRAEDEGDIRALRFPRRVRGTFRYLFRNTVRAARGRFKRYGTAAIGIGTPLDLRRFLESESAGGSRPGAPRPAGLERLAGELMDRIGKAIPALPVPIAAAALRGEPSPVSRDRLVERIEEVRSRLRESGGREPGDGRRSSEQLAEDAVRMLTLRRILKPFPGGGWTIEDRERPLLDYYAHSLDPLLEGFRSPVGAR